MSKTTGSDTKKLSFILNCAYIALIAAIGYLAIKYLLGWVMPLLIGFVLAAAVQSPVRYFHEKYGMNAKAASIAGVLIIVAAAGLLTALGASHFLKWLYASAGQLPGTVDSMMSGLNALSARLSPFFKGFSAVTGLSADTSLSGISSQLIKLSQLPAAGADLIHSAVSSLPSLLLGIVVSVVSACFIAADYAHVTGFLMRCLPRKHRGTVREIRGFFLTTVLKLARAYLTLMLITFCELAVGLALLRVSHPVAIAAVIAVVDLMPVLGTGTVLIPWMFIEFVMGNVYLGAGLALVYAVVTVVRNILEPKIVGHHIGLHPLVTLTAILLGLKALGVAGMVVFPIAVIIIKRLHDSGTIKLWRD